MNKDIVPTKPLLYDQDADTSLYDQDKDHSFTSEEDHASIVDLVPHIEAKLQRDATRRILIGEQPISTNYTSADTLVRPPTTDYENVMTERSHLSKPLVAGLGATAVAGLYFVTDRFNNVAHNLTHLPQVIEAIRSLV